MQKLVNLVHLVKSFPTNIYLQNLASIQKRTSPVKFAHLAEESDNGSVSNLSTKALLQQDSDGNRRYTFAGLIRRSTSIIDISNFYIGLILACIDAYLCK